jgi:polysaccharide pyruvyl transferase WcaK-like protein
MRIGIIGWYGHGNAGDERMLYCLRRFFEGHDIYVADAFEEASRNREQLNRCDCVLLGGGGLILRGFGVYAWLIEQMRPPFACVGISVEAVHPDNRAFLEAIKEKAEFILVRDERSRDLLDNHPKVVVGPDLTFLYPYDAAESPAEETCGLNLRNWHYWKAEYRGLPDRIMRRLNRRFHALRMYYPLPKWRPDRAVSVLRRHFANLVPIPLYAEPGAPSDAQIMQPYFDYLEEEFRPERLAGCGYLAGMRLHALIFACQMGIPFLSLTYQPKNKEFCRSIGMEQYSIDLFHLAGLSPAVERLKRDSRQFRSHLLEVRETYRRNITDRMKELLGSFAGGR